jgi:uncharacterized protein YeaO (DUF488 family)
VQSSLGRTSVRESIIGLEPSRRNMARVAVKRVYEEPGEGDGTRILVDRLWPRGMTKEKARVDLWLKEIAPSTKLRKWFGHDPARWVEFQSRYLDELKNRVEAMAFLKREVARGPVTLLFGARDMEHNEAVILKKVLQRE